jgi:alcohol dehydrogenase (cytochrome c)
MSMTFANTSRRRLMPGVLVVVVLAAVTGRAARDVTTDRLRNADNEPENWMVYGGTYRSLRHTGLKQINTRNVRTLQTAWAFQLGIVDNGLQSTPLVADGVMYLIGNDHHVYAVDATNGREIWHYRYEESAASKGSSKAPPPIETARGLALGHGHVYFGTDDNFVVALDVNTGKEVWRTNVEDREKFGCFMRAAPLVVNDVVIVGSRGGDSAHRGHLVAFDGKTGKQRWWFNVIPGPGEKGNESWAGDTWMYGGGAPWMTGSYDPELELVYWGTSNTSSDFYGEHRTGDNLYTNSIVALKPATGELVWHFQTVPHDVWDYDAVYEQILVDLPVNGRSRKLLIHPSKNGFVYVLDRTNGEYISGWKYADMVTWTTGLDRNGVPQGRREPRVEEATFICPNFFGSRSWNQATYSPSTGLLYNIGIEWCGEFTARKQEGVPGKPWLGGAMKLTPPPSGKVTSHLDAFEPISGKRIWRRDTKHPLAGALLSTAGDLLFYGDPEGNFSALNGRTGETLWTFQTGSGHRGGPISYGVNGKQYVATPSGWGSTMGARLGEFFPELVGSRRGATIFAFKLPDGERQ